MTHRSTVFRLVLVVVLLRLAVSATYARTIYGNFSVTDNLNLTPADYDPYCITLPTDSRLPRSGQQLCGLWDQRINVATSNLVGLADATSTGIP